MISLFGCQLGYAQAESCVFYNSEVEGVEVGQIGNRQIYTLFTFHLSGQRNEVLAIINSHEPADAVAPLNQLLEKYQDTIESEQSDLRKIKELAESGKIDWIGIEDARTGTSYLDDATDAYLMMLYTLDIFLNPLPKWDPRKTAQLLSLSFHAFIIAQAVYPEVQRIRIHPLEDENLKIESAARINDSDYWERLIREDTRVTFRQYSEVMSFVRDAILPRPRLISEDEFEDLLDRLEVQEDARINMRTFMRAHNDVISLVPKRDRAVVQSILDLPGNGLILFGIGHSFGIKQGLITACQNGNGSP